MSNVTVQHMTYYYVTRPGRVMTLTSACCTIMLGIALGFALRYCFYVVYCIIPDYVEEACSVYKRPAFFLLSGLFTQRPVSWSRFGKREYKSTVCSHRLSPRNIYFSLRHSTSVIVIVIVCTPWSDPSS